MYYNHIQALCPCKDLGVFKRYAFLFDLSLCCNKRCPFPFHQYNKGYNKDMTFKINDRFCYV